MRVVLGIDAFYNIESFYKAFARKHQNDYSIQMMVDNINQVVDGVLSIDVNRSRVPILPRHQALGYREYPFIRIRGTRFDWYAEYTVETNDNGEGFILVHEVLHRSQMHESAKQNNRVLLNEDKLRRIVRETLIRLYS